MSWVKKAAHSFGFWMSPAGEITEFEYGLFNPQSGYWHAETLDDGLVDIPKEIREQVLKSEYPEDEMMKYGWVRGVVQGNEEAELQMAEGTDVEHILSLLPFVTNRLMIDVGDQGYALLLNEDEDFAKAWRNRNRPRVFASSGNIWVRMGDGGEYESFGSPSDAGEYVGETYRTMAETHDDDNDPLPAIPFVSFIDLGVLLPLFSGQDYISLYHGDEEAQPVEPNGGNLTNTEQAEFKRSFLRSAR